MSQGILIPFQKPGSVFLPNSLDWICSEISRLHSNSAIGKELRQKVLELQKIADQLLDAKALKYVHLLENADNIANSISKYHAFFGYMSLFPLYRELLQSPKYRSQIRLSISGRCGLGQSSVVDFLTHREIPLEEKTIQVLQKLDGKTDLQEALSIIQNHADEETVDELVEELTELFRVGILCVPEIDPISLPSAWALNFFDEHIASLSDLDLSDDLRSSLEAISDREKLDVIPLRPSRSHEDLIEPLQKLDIEMFLSREDNTFFLEDSAFDVKKFALGGKLQQDLQKNLENWFRFVAYRNYAEEKHTHEHIRSIVPNHSKVPFASFLRQLKKRSRNREKLNYLASLIGQQRSKNFSFRQLEHLTADERISVDYEFDSEKLSLQIKNIEFPEDFETWFQTKRFVSSLDLMLIGSLDQINQDKYEVLLNEGHRGGGELPLTTHFDYVQSSKKREEIPCEHANIFPPDLLVEQATIATKQSTSILSQLHPISVIWRNGTFLWMLEDRLVPISELYVRREGHQVFLESSSQRHRMILRYHPTPNQGAWFGIGNFRVVGFNAYDSRVLVDTVGLRLEESIENVVSTPEVRIGNIVMQRRSVTANVSTTMAGLINSREKELMEEAKKLQKALRLPDCIFAKFGDKKPVLCDFNSLFSMDALANDLRNWHGRVQLTSMSPREDQLWLKTREGHHTSELRFVAYMDGDDFSMDGEYALDV